MAEPMGRHLPSGRHLAVDEQGVGLRATWRLERGCRNLSLWRDDRCVETFHLTPAAAADLVAFLARGLADASDVAAEASIHQLPQQMARSTARIMDATRTATRTVRARMARSIDDLATRIAP